MINAVANPLVDPIGFIVSLFLFGTAVQDVSAFFKIILMGSVMAFPFCLLGGYLFRKISEKTNYFARMLATTFITTSCFFIFFGLWRAAFGAEFYAGASLTMNIVLGTVFSFPLALFCNYVKEKKLWDVPEKLNAYIFCLAGSALAFFILWLIFIISLAVG